MVPEIQSAASEVFQTAELLEQILSDLSIDRLLIVKRVSKFWNAVVDTSPELQRIMYLRANTKLDSRQYNPLFEDFFSDIGCAGKARKIDASREPPAHLKISGPQMRKLLRTCPQALRSMSMFQPPCPFFLTLPSMAPWNFTVKFINDADTPIVRAVEKASMLVQMEEDKLKNRRHYIETQLRPGVRGASMVHKRPGGHAGAVNA